MKTKEELIREAWKYLVNLPEILSSITINDNGWLNCDDVPSEIYHSGFLYQEDGYMRPESLRGLEENNGWITINSKQDMPDYDCLVEICREGIVKKGIFKWYFKDGLLELTELPGHKFWDRVSHYQIYTPKKPPLY